MSQRECSRGHGLVEKWCPGCNKELDSPRDPKTMTGDERVAELKSWGIAEVPFGRIHERIEALVGRSVWTHEMGSRGWPMLLEEARTWKHPDDLLEHVLTSAEEAAPGRVIPVVLDGS